MNMHTGVLLKNVDINHNDYQGFNSSKREELEEAAVMRKSAWCLNNIFTICTIVIVVEMCVIKEFLIPIIY